MSHYPLTSPGSKYKQPNKTKDPFASVYYAFHHAAQMRETTRKKKKKVVTSPGRALAQSNQTRYIKCINMLPSFPPNDFQSPLKERGKTPNSLMNPRTYAIE
ncbi:hypothetical protein COCCADRAFT_105961 [Bipolaris zeicola 26-R-13]|uniref:Uncharacterized protein n=1 Tax=Cochliobolus carbonum (strain 26-R-13) TaxID=930089 RepID=W6XWP8_COCC2|nr:uncharacterized protein COCCADRAFT_105961 [Bipolaris zeicola 26-R-13]EUC29655.1 hypothetical protein COCCADRAFT_105961 [Bipolaris zeicola 26-R-13]